MSGYGYGGSRSSGFSWRIIIAIIIALFGVVSYYSNSSINPVTGEKQHVRMSPKEEIALGLQTAPRMASEMGGLVQPNDPLAKLVKSIGQAVVEGSAASRSPYEFDFHLLRDDQTVNAFALPGGQIFMTLGLFQKLRSEAAVAGVLGHEVGHVVGRHSSEHLEKARLGQTLVIATGVAGSGDRDGDGRPDGQGAFVAANVVNQMTQLRFSRSDESEADSLGLQFMVEAGYDPSAMLEVMKVLAEASKGNRPPQFLVTHPYPEARIEQIKAWLAQKYPNGIPPHLTRGKSL